MQEYYYQLYSSRKFGPLPDTLEMLSAAGYAGVECFGDLIFETGLAEELSGNGLRAPVAHVALEAIESVPDRIIGAALQLGIKQIYVPYVMAGERPADSQGWKEFGHRLAAAGQPFFEAGIGFGWHNHDFEFQACEDGLMPIECLLEGDNRLLLELDIAWVRVAGEDPLTWINRLAGRIAAVHIKDIARDGQCENEDGWADVGHGTLDWRTLTAALDPIPGLVRVLEHDNPSDDRRFAERSMASLRAMEG